jgi:hypothetical protein
VMVVVLVRVWFLVFDNINKDIKVAVRPTLKEANEYLKKQLIFQICTYVMS